MWNVHNLPNEIAVSGEGKDIVAQVRQAPSLSEGDQVQYGCLQVDRKAGQVATGLGLAFHCFLVGQARLAGQTAAPYQTVTQDGPLEEFTWETKHSAGSVSITG